MSLPVYVYDPTAGDAASRVRGVGRYLQILRENFENEFVFTSSLDRIPYDSIFLNPFYNFLQPPLSTRRLAKYQVAVIHDLIPLKFPQHFPVGLRGKLNIFRNKVALRQYDHIITDSVHSKRSITEILHVKQPVSVIYPTLPKIFWEPHAGSKSALGLPQAYCVYVGDATWNKNLLNLARAIKLCDLPCVLVGKGFVRLRDSPDELSHPWHAELRDFFQLIQSDKRFIFPGFVSDSDLVNIYQQSVCNVLVSRDEGFGFSYFEASSQTTVSVLSTEEIFYETAGDTAMYGATADPVDIATKITSIFGNQSLRSFLSLKAKARTEMINREKFKHDFRSLIKEYFS